MFQLETLEDRTLLTAGLLDTSFSGDGKVLTDVGFGSNQEKAWDIIAYQSDMEGQFGNRTMSPRSLG